MQIYLKGRKSSTASRYRISDLEKAGSFHYRSCLPSLVFH
jgi:hypothetical protein